MSNPNTDRDGRVRAPQIDWQQVVLNGGPPCFFVEGPQYCGRAERWPGHGNEAFHDYVSLNDLLTTVREEARETAFKEALDATTRVHLACGATGSADFQEGIRNGVILGANQIREALRATIEAAASSPTPAESVTPEQIVYNVAQRDPRFRKHLIEQLTALGNEQDRGPLRKLAPAERTRVERECARDVVNEILNVPRFIRNPEDTIIEIEGKVAAIISKHFAAAPADNDAELKGESNA